MMTPTLQEGLGVDDCEAPSIGGHLSVPCFPAEVTPPPCHPLPWVWWESLPLPLLPGLRVPENLPGQVGGKEPARVSGGERLFWEGARKEGLFCFVCSS